MARRTIHRGRRWVVLPSPAASGPSSHSRKRMVNLGEIIAGWVSGSWAIVIISLNSIPENRQEAINYGSARTGCVGEALRHRAGWCFGEGQNHALATIKLYAPPSHFCYQFSQYCAFNVGL